MADGSPNAQAFDLQQIAAAMKRDKSVVIRRANAEKWPFSEHAVRGGKRRQYTLNTLPTDVQTALLLASTKNVVDHALSDIEKHTRRRWTPEQLQSAWTRYEKTPDSQKKIAQQRLTALQAVAALVRNGLRLGDARAKVAAQMQRDQVRGASVASLGRWAAWVANAPRDKWLALLLPHYLGRVAFAAMDEEAFDIFCGLYLSRKQPAASTCYRRVEDWARENKIQAIPSLDTFMRRLEARYAPNEIVWEREGEDGLQRMLVPQQRDRSLLRAMEAVNGDAILFVPWCVWPTGEIARPKVWYWQDLFSGKVLSWRADVSENSEMLRLAFGDLVERWGIPDVVVLDNTMAAANTKMSGGIKNRFRFSVKDETITGILPMMDVTVRFTKPAHGQSKPIERAFRDLRELIDHHPAYGKGATKANPMPIADWLAIADNEINRHNAQLDRRGGSCKGRSFDQLFNESYAATSIRKATAEQRRLWLLAADKVRVNAKSYYVVLGRNQHGENRYKSEALIPHLGQNVVVRFDPQAMHDSVHIYTLSGEYICEAACDHAKGYFTEDHGRAAMRAESAWKKSTKAAAAAKKRMDDIDAIARIPKAPAPERPTAGVLAPQFGKNNTATSTETGGDVIPLQRTGTDHDVPHESRLSAHLKRMQENQLRNASWVPPPQDD